MEPSEDLNTKIQFNRGRPNIETPHDKDSVNFVNTINRNVNPERELVKNDHENQSITETAK